MKKYFTYYLLGLCFTLCFFSTGLAATISVTTQTDSLSDDGFCSLREAVRNANDDIQVDNDNCTAGSGDDTLSIPAGTYQLTLGASGEDAAAEGDLDFDNNTTLSGAGASSTIIDASGLTADGNGNRDRVLHLTSSDSLTISGITITGGNVDGRGGAIYSASNSTLTISNSTISNNTVEDTGSGYGGAIASQGELFLTNVTISNNELNGTSVLGGAIYASDNCTISDSTISNNTATASSGGVQSAGIYFSSNNTLSITNSIISGNQANGATSSYGAGIYSRSNNTLTLTSSTISGNNANASSSTAAGAGMYSGAGDSLTITGSTFSSNTATSATSLAYAGALFMKGTSTNLTSANITNSTISGNSVTNDGTLDSAGGGIYVLYGDTLLLNQSTLYGNTAGDAGGGILFQNITTLQMKGTILAGNTATTGPDCYEVSSTSSELTSMGYNLLGDTTDCDYDSFTGDFHGNYSDTTGAIDALLEDLADNGGETFTHALESTSPALDAGSCTDINGSTISTDQRGQSRSDGLCDSGAFEYQTTPICGDSYKDGSEECDDGNTTDGDGCESTCIATITSPETGSEATPPSDSSGETGDGTGTDDGDDESVSGESDTGEKSAGGCTLSSSTQEHTYFSILVLMFPFLVFSFIKKKGLTEKV